jgi:methylated-DNA-[protein]-cysteine S-methyltransferase
MKTMSYYSLLSTPIGELLLTADAMALTGVYFAGCDHIPAASRSWKRNPRHAILRQTADQLQEYFAGARKNFSLTLQLAGTPFQKAVWREIARIPYGETTTYSELARRAGAPRAIRAAGTSTGQNPFSIIIPCHRVVGKGGKLRGFAGGLERKRQLLELERAESSSRRRKEADGPKTQ